VYADDVGMPEVGGKIGLALEPGTVVRGCRDVGPQQFQGVAAGQPGMLGQVDLAHPAGTDGPQDAVSGKQVAAAQ
jgi:hypothetical protein